MFAATVSPAATAATLRSLINAATTGQVPDVSVFNGRCFEIIFQWATLTVDVNWKAGTVGASDSGFQLSTSDRSLTLRAPTHNQLSIDDVYLSSSGGGTARVIVNVL